MGKRKKKSRREEAKFPALKPEFNLKTRGKWIDYDYLDKLSEEEKRFLNNFTEEYYGGDFRHDGKILHDTEELKKDCYDRNNARNRCILTRGEASNRSVNLSELTNQEHDTLKGKYSEEYLVARVDLKRQVEKLEARKVRQRKPRKTSRSVSDRS